MIFTGAIHKGFYALVIIAVMNAAVAAFYYLKMARAAYCGADDEQESIVLPFGAKVMGAFFILSIILIGALPQSFLAAAKEAVVTLL
jgi:NADH-quinone oxidoreductase subunit N